MEYESHEGFCSGTYFFDLGQVHDVEYGNDECFFQDMVDVVSASNRHMYCVTNSYQDLVREQLAKYGFTATPFSGQHGVWMHTAMRENVLAAMAETYHGNRAYEFGLWALYGGAISEGCYVVPRNNQTKAERPLTRCNLYQRAYKVLTVSDDTFTFVKHIGDEPTEVKKGNFMRVIRVAPIISGNYGDECRVTYAIEQTNGDIAIYTVVVQKDHEMATASSGLSVLSHVQFLKTPKKLHGTSRKFHLTHQRYSHLPWNTASFQPDKQERLFEEVSKRWQEDQKILEEEDDPFRRPRSPEGILQSLKTSIDYFKNMEKA